MSDHLATAYLDLTREATRLAGGLTDLAQRATVYHHLFRASEGNHIFPLIAAHGALWAGGYFRTGMSLAGYLSWQYAWQPELRQNRLAQLDAFANTFRDINRRVCIDTYVNFHFTARYGDDERLGEFIPAELIEPLRKLHQARDSGQPLSDDEKRRLYSTHFLHEQTRIVGPQLEQAVAEFDWPLVRALALRPPVRFTYFPAGIRFWFRDFSQREERIARGLRAFEIAQQVGWRATEEALRDYNILPTPVFTDSLAHFAMLKHNVLALS